MPIGACLADSKCSGVLCPGTHGSTFGGNPIACAGGKAVLERVGSEGFLDEVKAKADYMRAEIAKSSEIESVTGLGMMIGIKLKNKKAGDVVKDALDKGLLLLTAKDRVRLLPPLTITMEEIKEGLDILMDILNK